MAEQFEIVWWAGPDLNRRPSARQAPGISTEELLTRFREFLKVDLRRSSKTAYEHTYYVKKFLNALTKPVESTTAEDVREHLKSARVFSEVLAIVIFPCSARVFKYESVRQNKPD